MQVPFTDVFLLTQPAFQLFRSVGGAIIEDEGDGLHLAPQGFRNDLLLDKGWVLDKQLQALEVQGISLGQWKVERNRLKAEAESEMAELWQRVYRVLDKSNKEHARWERYCREQCDLLRELEDLAALERTMYELDNRKDQIMTVFKLALTNLVMWPRDQCFPPTYTHATWGRLLPFFQLSGVVTSSQSAVCVQLHPFNDRQYNRDLLLVCQRVNEKYLHLPDGRLLLFSVKECAHPILHQQQRLIA